MCQANPRFHERQRFSETHRTVVEVDETFVGGKDKNRHWDKKSGKRGGTATGKVGVIGAISRKGNVTGAR